MSGMREGEMLSSVVAGMGGVAGGGDGEEAAAGTAGEVAGGTAGAGAGAGFVLAFADQPAVMAATVRAIGGSS